MINKTIRQQLIKEVARKIDNWNFPIWLAIQENTVNSDGSIIETVGELEVKRYPIYCTHEQAILNQVQEILSSEILIGSGWYDTKLYVLNLSPKGETRLINDIKKELRYKIYGIKSNCD